MELNVTHGLGKEKAESRTFLSQDYELNRIIASVEEEWQFWALLTENFTDLKYHRAYMCFVLMRREINGAISRYKKYRDVLIFLPEERAKILIIDQMLQKLQSLALMHLDNSRDKQWFGKFEYLNSQRILWLVVGVSFALMTVARSKG